MLKLTTEIYSIVEFEAGTFGVEKRIYKLGFLTDTLYLSQNGTNAWFYLDKQTYEYLHFDSKGEALAELEHEKSPPPYIVKKREGYTDLNLRSKLNG